MIRKELIEAIYGAASIQRWNDHIRPHKGFTELDKQAHKMIYAYLLGKMEESDRKAEINWTQLIEGGIFEFLHRIVLTDLKPPIFHQLMAEKGDKLNLWVIEQLHDSIKDLPGSFAGKFEKYFFSADYSNKEKKILRAAHYLATNWEFKIIYHLNAGLYGIEDTKKIIENELEEHYDLAGVQKLQLGKKISNFMDLVGQLRFQQRWAQTPRIPETSVMGHMLIVALLSYFCTNQLSACNKRIVNNYFGGLFHDLPEVLTRDIISPIKRSVEGLDELIKEIEKKQVDEKLYPLLPDILHKEIKYFTEDEFQSKIHVDGGIEFVNGGSNTINKKYNEDKYNPLDGEIINVCDKFAAYVEASLSINHGINSRALREGYESAYKKYRDSKAGGIDFGSLFDYFKIK